MWSYSYPEGESLDINPGKVLELLEVNRDPPDGENGDAEQWVKLIFMNV